MFLLGLDVSPTITITRNLASRFVKFIQADYDF